MKRSKRVLGAFMAAAVLFANLMTVPVTAKAYEIPQNVAPDASLEGAGEVLYETDLSSMDEFDLYAGNNPGQWSIQDNALKIAGGTGNKAVAKGKDFADFIYESDVTVEKQADMSDTSSAQGGLIFRVSNAQGQVSDGYHGYYFGLDAKNQKVTLGRSSGNNWHEIASKKMSIKYGESYHVMVAAYKSHITCYVDYNGENYAKIDVEDSTHTSGSVGMRNWLSHTAYRNAVVRNYEETALEEDQSYINPLLNMCADPDILYHNGTYYLYPTNAGDANDDAGIKVYTSTDLVHWTDKGFAFKKGDGWGTANFWAPDTIERDGVFYMYYVANEQICVATSDSPLGPYKQDEKVPMHTDVKEIDAHVFYDEASQKYYIYFVRFTGGNVIWGAELNDDMKSIKEDTITEIVRADQGWDEDMGRINEGPFMLTKDGKYYMTYSGSHFQSPNYGSGYAVSDSPLGPFKKYEYNPIMQSNSLAHGTGHHCITSSPDGKELFMVYHSHHDLNTTEPRQLCIDRMQFTKDRDGNTILEVKGPTVTPQALPSGASDVNNFIEFNKKDLQMISVENGAPVSEWNLPSQVGIITSKGDGDTTYTALVEWDTKDYDPNEKESQDLTIKGKAVLPEGISNLGGIELVPEIQVRVKSTDDDMDTLQEALQKIEIKNADDIRENITLPEKFGDVELQWESDSEKVISAKAKKNQDYYDAPAGIVTRQKEDRQVTLTVTGSYKGKTAQREIKVTVKAQPEEKKYAAYLYAHFKEFAGVKGEQDIFYGISKNGLDWTALNDNNAVLKSTVGDHATRDPYIIRSAQGDKFYLIATDQDIYRYGDNIRWDLLSTEGSQALTIWESTDLVHWTNQRNVPVADSIQAGCAWAPEAIYDEATGEYLVYWSSKVESDGYARQYSWVSKTRDFYTFTEPELFNDLSISNIDTSMHREGDKYYKLLKLEDGGNTHVILQSAEKHPLAYGDEVNQVLIGNETYNNVGGTYKQINNSAAGCLESFKGSYEGAAMFKYNDREEWCIMVDEYGGQTRGYIPFTTTDLDAENSVKALANDAYIMQDGGKHGVILPITQEEYDALILEYGVAKGPVASMEEQSGPVISYDFENTAEGSKKVESAGAVTNGTNKKFDMELFGNAKVQYDEEKKSNVLYLDGSKETYAELPQGAFDTLDQMTISMDIKPETTEENHVDFCIGQDNNRYLYMKFSDETIRAGSTVRSWKQEKNLYAREGGYLNRWVNATMVVENHNMTLYIDNKKVGTQKARNVTELGNALKCYLGKSFYDDPYFKGSYDNVKIYNRAMDEEEIGVHYDMVQKLEAENASLTGKAKVVERDDASGKKKVGSIDDAASTVTFSLYAPEAGTYRVEIAADGNPGEFPNSSHRYWVNGEEEHAKIVKYKTRGWDKWDLYPVELELKKGDNKLTISHSGIDKSFSELDYIMYYMIYPDLEVSVGGKQLDDFDMNTSAYNLDAESLSSLPKVEAALKKEVKGEFDVKVTQGTKQRPEAYINVTSEEYPELNKQFTIRFYGEKTFQNPLVNYGADPYVTYEDGYYYYIRVEHDRAIYVSKSAELSRIGQVEPKLVYTPSGDEPSAEMWAPEIHFIDGNWYIYYTAGAGAGHRMHVLKSKTEDAQGEYSYAGRMAPATDKWAIDQTVLEHNGQLYAIWSGWEGDVNVDQRIYIAKMDSPTSITGERVELSKPEYDWEKQGGTPTINEGAQIVKSPDGTVNIVYSASGSWSDEYCLGSLTLKENGDPMDKGSWMKSSKPVFEKNGSTTFSTGHACFVPSPDGTENYIVYHATRNSGEGWNGRGVRTQRFYWNEDGTPYFGEAIEYNGKVNWPSGTKVLDYMRYEAEEAVLSGKLKIEETYNSSNGKKVTGFTDTKDQAVFKVNVDKKGRYKLYIGAAAGVDQAGFTVQINDGQAVDKGVVNFNAGQANGICTDNWAGYELEITLQKVENTILISKGDALNMADLDYIELLLQEEIKDPVKDLVTDVYEDVEKDDWFVDYVQYVYDHKYMTGLDETHFGPNGVLSRAQFATILYRMEGSPKVTYKPTFPDVVDGEFYSEAVIWASAKDVGVIGGYADGTFGPGDDLTREQMAVMLYRYAEYKGYDMSAKGSLKDFPDGKLVSPFAEKAMQWAVGAGVISGNADKTLAPQGTTSRAVCATMIMRVQELLGGNKE